MNRLRRQRRYAVVVAACLFTSFANPVMEAKTPHWVVKETEFGTGIKTASAIVQYHGTCVWVQIFFISGQFFKGLRVSETPIGPQFSKNKTLMESFPDRLIVDFEATVQKCNPRINEIIPPNYATDLMTGATFEVSWKGREETRAVRPLSSEERHRPGLRWDYFLEFSSKEVPLTDDLVIETCLRSCLKRASVTAGLDFLNRK